MTFLSEWLDTGMAKRATEVAFREKYPLRDQGIATTVKSEPEALLVIMFCGSPTDISFWRVMRETFTVTEIAPPDEWPSEPPLGGGE